MVSFRLHLSDEHGVNRPSFQVFNSSLFGTVFGFLSIPLGWGEFVQVDAGPLVVQRVERFEGQFGRLSGADSFEAEWRVGVRLKPVVDRTVAADKNRCSFDRARI